MKGMLGITLEFLVLEISRMFVSVLEDYLTKPGLPKRKILFQMIWQPKEKSILYGRLSKLGLVGLQGISPRSASIYG